MLASKLGMAVGRRLARPELDVDTVCMRITIRVKPGSARPSVGGEHDGALIVRVSARAVGGKATEAALTAVADSFGVRRSAVRLVSGASTRTKMSWRRAGRGTCALRAASTAARVPRTDTSSRGRQAAASSSSTWALPPT
jgi:uncharacterized protein